ncbi:MAG: putative membrane transporter protein [Sporanaerobacter sp.]|jgi:uncharacterized protein|uniref:sulfite exporter TauE/SafE family protein n=1 Tax=Sporanaerobacter sp. TaxID=2010183 RepID=UPI003A100033
MKKNNLKIISIGLITGLINGLFGSGGGTIIVPTMTFLLGIDDHKAHATAIAVILPLTIISTIIYCRQNIIKYDVAFKVAIGGIAGSFIGSNLLNKVPTNILRKIFGSFMILAAIRLLIK